MWMVIVPAPGLVVYHSPREPILARGVSSTKLDEVTLTPGLRVTLVSPALMVLTPDTLSALMRPLARTA